MHDVHDNLPTEANLAARVRVKPEWNLLTSRILQAAMDVHSELGPGLLESLYEEALCFELTERGIAFQRQLEFPIPYKTIVLRQQRCDVLVDSIVILELKSVDKVDDRHLAAMVGYMRALDAPLGLLLNFHQMRLKDGIYRRLNPRSSKFISETSVIAPDSTLPLRTSALTPRTSVY